jgi:uncharacterized protein involved in type VI secretion and phage assembly
MRPVATVPEVALDVEGVPLEPADRRALVGVRVQQRLSVPTLCELEFADPPGPLGAADRLAPGVELWVGVGDGGKPEPLFSGQVTAVEHVYEPDQGRRVRVRAYDRLHQLRKRQQVRAYTQLTVRDLAEELAGGVGLSVEADEDGPFSEHLVQHRQSDLDLLVEAGDRCGLYLTVRGDVLHLVTLAGLGEPVALELGDSLLEARIDLNGDPACRSVTATGWDPARVETHEGQASSARVGRAVAAEVPPDRMGASGERSLVDELAWDDTHAAALAQAELDARVAREVTFAGVSQGDPRLRPATPVVVAGVAETLSGRFVLSSVTHVVDERVGFVSELSTEPPPPRPRPRGTVATAGIVSSIDDPDGLGRVRVTLPSFNGAETGWLGVMAAGAGSGKGLMMSPDRDDHVLVLLPEGQPAQGVVLGGLWGTTAPPDSGIEGGAVRRFTLLTPGGQRIRLDDAGQAVRLENSTGSYVELAPERVVIHAMVQLEIEAPGQPVVISGASIDFRSG